MSGKRRYVEDRDDIKKNMRNGYALKYKQIVEKIEINEKEEYVTMYTDIGEQM